MARKVFVSSDMSVDERLMEVAEIDPTAALLWPWLLTAFDDWGRCEASPRKLKARVFPTNPLVTVDLLATAMVAFDVAGLIQLYEVEGKRYAAVDPEKWFGYQTHIHKSKREEDRSRFPAPRDRAEPREIGTQIVPSPSPSTLPPFHPSEAKASSPPKKKPELIPLTLAERQKLVADFPDIPEVNEEIDRALAHESHLKYPTGQYLYVRGWLRRAREPRGGTHGTANQRRRPGAVVVSNGSDWEAADRARDLLPRRLG